jgi:hypothetical protein
VLISGPARDDSPTIVRTEGTLHEHEPIADGQIRTDDPALTPTFAVNGAQVSMFAPEVERVERLTDQERLVIHQRHAVFESVSGRTRSAPERWPAISQRPGRLR